MAPEQPARFGKYLLLERIGIGGMAEVFKAKTFGAEGFERLVAIKRILPHLVEDDDFVNMFIDEAKIAVRLNHPNIVGIHDLGKAEGTLFIAMEFVQGRDLRAIYDYEAEHEGHPPIGLCVHIVMKMCEALHHAHFATGSRGEPLNVIHRDVSPQNVLVSYDGEVKVADFGLAKARGRMVQTQAGVVKGKLAYMSPEQLRGEDIDHRVDVFGLGIVLYELLAGERLFLGPTDMDTLRRVYEARVPPMQELNPDVHPELETIVRKALAKDRDQRYQTALQLHDDLQSFVYAHRLFKGAAALRTYLREAFPDAAPLAPAVLHFADMGDGAGSMAAPSAPTVPERPMPQPTLRPPRLAREEVLPPSVPPPLPPKQPSQAPSVAHQPSLAHPSPAHEPVVAREPVVVREPVVAREPVVTREVFVAHEVEESGVVDPSRDVTPRGGPLERPTPVAPSMGGVTPAIPLALVSLPSAAVAAAGLGDDEYEDQPTNGNTGSFDDDFGRDLFGGDEFPTDRPPPPADAVVARAVVATGRPPPPEHSGTVPADPARFPSRPPGLDDGPVDAPRSGGSDTSPAPPLPPQTPFEDFGTGGWDEDEPTVTVPVSKDLIRQLTRESEDEDEPWSDEGESTVNVDPLSSQRGR